MKQQADRNQDARDLFDRLRENRSGRAAQLTTMLTAALVTERRLMAQRCKARVDREARYFHGSEVSANAVLGARVVNRILDEEAER